MTNGISKKVFITANVFSGLLGMSTKADSSKERLIIAAFVTGVFALYLIVQGIIDYSKKEKEK